MKYRVDYLTASGTAAPYGLLARLEVALPHVFSHGRQVAGRYGYGMTLDCSKPGVTALLRFKIAPHPSMPTDYMLEVSGRAADAARRVLAHSDPLHQVARIDVCRDVIAPGQFAHYAECLQDMADTRGIRYRRLFYDPRDPAAGGTLYVGSPDSEARDVLYDKHAQDETYEPGTLRFEHRLRPKAKARKRSAADFHPAAAFRVGCIGADIASLLDLAEHAAATLPAPKDKTAADAIDYMLRSYRRKLQALALEIGGAEAVMQFIRERLPEALGPIAEPTVSERRSSPPNACCPEAREAGRAADRREDMRSASVLLPGTRA